MKTIYKYEIPLIITDIIELELSEDAEILTVQTQNNKPQIWVKTSSNYNTFSIKTRYFKLFGTGDSLLYPDVDLLKYIGTFQLKNGFVGHLFELLKREVKQNEKQEATCEDIKNIVKVLKEHELKPDKDGLINYPIKN